MLTELEIEEEKQYTGPFFSNDGAYLAFASGKSMNRLYIKQLVNNGGDRFKEVLVYHGSFPYCIREVSFNPCQPNVVGMLCGDGGRAISIVMIVDFIERQVIASLFQPSCSNIIGWSDVSIFVSRLETVKDENTNTIVIPSKTSCWHWTYGKKDAGNYIFYEKLIGEVRRLPNFTAIDNARFQGHVPSRLVLFAVDDGRVMPYLSNATLVGRKINAETFRHQ